jgi:alpha-beta hydrolase superfamily lysophospholipase
VKFAPACSRCKTPVHFLIGGQDPMIPLYTDALRRWYQDCGGHTLVWNALPGVTHDSIVDLLQARRARELVDWLMQFEQACQ